MERCADGRKCSGGGLAVQHNRWEGIIVHPQNRFGLHKAGGHCCIFKAHRVVASNAKHGQINGAFSGEESHVAEESGVSAEIEAFTVGFNDESSRDPAIAAVGERRAVIRADNCHVTEWEVNSTSEITINAFLDALLLHPSANFRSGDDSRARLLGEFDNIGDMIIMGMRDQNEVGFDGVRCDSCSRSKRIVGNEGVKHHLCRTNGELKGGVTVKMKVHKSGEGKINAQFRRNVGAKMGGKGDLKEAFIGIAALSICCLLVAGCSKEAKNEAIIRINFDNGLSTLDPAFARDGNSTQAVTMLYEGLYQLDSQMNPVPNLGTLDSSSSSPTNLVFHITSNRFFHSDPCFKEGKAKRVVAQDVVYSFNRLIDSTVASPGAWVFRDLVNGEKPFEAPNDSTFQLNLQKPTPDILALLTVVYTSIVPREAVVKYGANFRQHPVGTGPMRFSYWKEGEALALAKNLSYPTADKIETNGVIIQFLPDRQMGLVKAMQGDFHLASSLDQATIQALENKDLSSGRLAQWQVLNTEYIAMRTDTPPLNDVRLRRALKEAIDVEALVSELRPKNSLPATKGFVPPALGVGVNSSERVNNEDNKSKSKVKFPPLTLHTTQNYLDIALGLQRQWRAHGIEVGIELNTGQLIRQRSAQGELTLWRASWIADYPSPRNYLQLFASANKAPSGPNVTRYSSAVYDQRFESASSTADYQALQQIIADEAIVLPLFYDMAVWYVSNEISEVKLNALGYFDLRQIRWKR